MTVRTAYLLAALGAACWGLIGLFVQNLYSFGLTPWDVVAIRSIFAAVILLIYMLLVKRQQLKIKVNHLPLFIGSGIVSIVFFNWCFFTVMEDASLSLAVVLLYTGPLFVTILSRMLFKELITFKKMLAILTTLAGCAFVVGFLPSANTFITVSTLLIGLSSGFFYALYSIFAKLSSRYYGALTITAYTYFCAALFMVFTSDFTYNLSIFLSWSVLLNSLALAIIPTIIAFLLYTKGLSYIESSRASILSTIEPVVAIYIGFIVFQDVLTLWQWFGVILVIASIILATSTNKKENKKTTSAHAS
ncbi:DMT family transporter [Halalkalibacter krulwichiae]|uniref:Putative inner membrane transporter YicL n=1 Tax=Halalkalibacter krulwichiae TaxID=199441 RepID=A0A1X9MGV0_9BACI|nr:EamA family transporter [Halalkalibacter krulwichiae]ARK30731.1 putative inner membrane transporter YicL [Halalkalibacter krulwichiae]